MLKVSGADEVLQLVSCITANGTEQLLTAAIAAFVKVHKEFALKVAVKVFAVPSAGRLTPVKVYDVAPMLLTATVADASPLNTKSPVVSGLV